MSHPPCSILRSDRHLPVCISQDPATKRRHPRGYLESLEQHNASLEQHVAYLESTILQIQPNIDLNGLASTNVDPIAEAASNSLTAASQCVSTSPSFARFIANV